MPVCTRLNVPRAEARFVGSGVAWNERDLSLHTCVQAVMGCLVDTYMELGAALLPYLEGLDTTQLQLVTAYAHRLSQARAVF
jgi:hypothetical protein